MSYRLVRQSLLVIGMVVFVYHSIRFPIGELRNSKLFLCSNMADDFLFYALFWYLVGIASLSSLDMFAIMRRRWRSGEPFDAGFLKEGIEFYARYPVRALDVTIGVFICAALEVWHRIAC